MLEWCGTEEKNIFQTKVMIVKLMAYDWHVFFSFERLLFQYFTRKKGEL